jgi:hypothetical protein
MCLDLFQVGNVLPYLFDCTFVKWGFNPDPSPTTMWTLVTGFATSTYCFYNYFLRLRLAPKAVNHYAAQSRPI